MKKLFKFLGSYGLAVVILSLLLAIVFLGTYEQKNLGLFDVQQRYFSSLYFWAQPPLLPFPIPLPGVYLLLILFSANLIIGTMQRVPLKREKAGMLIVHAGILFMLVSGTVSHHFSIDGQMTLLPGQTSNTFSSYHEWEIAVIKSSPNGQSQEWIIDEQAFKHLQRDSRSFSSSVWPFSFTLSNYARNAIVRPKGPMFEAPTEVIDGFFIAPQPPAKSNEMNLPAMIISIDAGDQSERTLLWGNSRDPLTLDIDGQHWDFTLRKKQWQTPFNVTLKEFRHEYHPGTQMARTYESDIIKTEAGHEQEILIKMNEPMRHKGYTFFQASFREFPDGTASSTFAVVKNPSDHWPLWGCIIITIGMLVHFGTKLAEHLRRSRASAKAEAASEKSKPAKKSKTKSSASTTEGSPA